MMKKNDPTQPLKPGEKNNVEVESINGFSNERNYIDHLISLGYKN